MKKYTLAMLAASTFLASHCLAGVEMSTTVATSQPAPVVVTTTTTTTSDCGCENPKHSVVFKDGIPSNGPVTADAGYGNVEGTTCGCEETFGFRDYGPKKVVIQATTPVALKPNS